MDVFVSDCDRPNASILHRPERTPRLRTLLDPAESLRKIEPQRGVKAKP